MKKKLLVGLLALTTLTTSANAAYYVNAGGGGVSVPVKYRDGSMSFPMTPHFRLGASVECLDVYRVGLEFRKNFDFDISKNLEVVKDYYSVVGVLASVNKVIAI